MKHSFGIFFICCWLIASSAQAQTPPANTILQKHWSALWLTVPAASPYGYGVYLFRKSVELESAPPSFVIHVSADNRYKLYVNETLVSLGPARGDLSHWNFETVDIAPYLKPGKNTIAAQVWNEGEWRPEAQITLRTGFILQGNTEKESIVNTNASWKCQQDKSYAPLRFTPRTYYVSGAGEIRHMAEHPKRWNSTNFDDKTWANAQPLFNGAPKTVLGPYGTTNGWMLVPSQIPQMEMTAQRFPRLVQVEGDAIAPVGFPGQQSDWTIPANTTLTLLLDQTYLTNAYPHIVFSGGKNASIAISYAEALYAQFPTKGNRNETAGKQFLGRTDSLIADGTAQQEFVALTYRTFRYVQISIQTKEGSLVLNDLYSIFTGYPFELKAALATDDEEMKTMLDIGWRTARLCATETYMDCPYYEQLQYIGDARIQGLVSLYNSGDDRLLKNALHLMDHSRQPEGVTLSRHPSYTPQYIPTFSLWYIGMLHDYSRYGSDVGFVEEKIKGVRQILEYFKQYQQEDGSLKEVPQWMFTDWVEYTDWHAGVGPMGNDGASALMDLQLLLAYQTAAELERDMGMPAYVAVYQAAAVQLQKTIWEKYWDKDKKLFADRAQKDVFSQHANTLAILTDLVEGEERSALAQQLVNNQNLAPASIYFKYYLHQALFKAGLGNDYLTWLDKWRENIQMGLTTWAEISDVSNTRSDCHAWGSSPNIEFYRTLLGIDSDGLGFSKVKIKPHLGEITQIGGSIPHPKGTIVVSYHLQKGQWKINIDLPPSTTGKLVWKGQEINLKAGKNDLTI
ncbi:MAG TPA: alpha-L-rhamnosidase C-terminal domain-containing protein [Saprospiraceae bacterium]|nr:alpha-L-rhamnosidase C-terminal domain-containing protein [Saprospiraceae bacterium]HMQ83329.1 alpha-L-rhamnosidase C-terminal domain-containing protein [Saprospiraceae bacterium]